MSRAMRLSLVNACLFSNMFLFLGAQTYTTFNGFYFVSNRHQDLAKATVTRRDVTSDRSGNYAGRSHSAFTGAFNSGFLRIARAAKRDAGRDTYGISRHGALWLLIAIDTVVSKLLCLVPRFNSVWILEV